MEDRRSAAPGTDGVHAGTRTRDPSFQMSGHHCHSWLDLFYVESGDCRFLIDEHIFDLHPGDFIMVPAMALHYTRYVFGPCRRTVILFRREDVPEEIWQSIPGGEKFFEETSVFQTPEAYRGQVADCLKRMTTEERIGDERSPLLRKLQLLERSSY